MLTQLIKDIKQKKELSALDDKFVKEELNRFFKREPKIFQKLKEDLNPKSKEYKKVVKEVRAKLRRSYGLFRVEKETKRTNKNKRLSKNIGNTFLYQRKVAFLRSVV